MKAVKYLSIIVLAGSLLACGAKNENKTEDTTETVVDVNTMNAENLIKEIEKREKIYKSEDVTDRENGVRLMRAYVAYAERFSNRKNAAEYLFEAARIAMAEEMTQDAIRYFDKLYFDFTHFEQRPIALFYKAFVLENLAKNLDEARLHYELFLQEYPTHDFANDARASIMNLGKSNEEIIRGFEKQDSIQKSMEAGV